MDKPTIDELPPLETRNRWVTALTALRDEFPPHLLATLIQQGRVLPWCGENQVLCVDRYDVLDALEVRPISREAAMRLLAQMPGFAQAPAPPPEPYVSVSRCVEVLKAGKQYPRVSRNKIYELAHANKIPALKKPHRTKTNFKVRVSEVVAALEASAYRPDDLAVFTAAMADAEKDLT